MVGTGIEYSQDEIMKLLKDGTSVMVRGGAGCGKTHSLVKTLQELLRCKPKVNISCITYTNAAADEVASRVNADRVRASTIHSFLWDLISQFQGELRECFCELAEDGSCKSIKLSEQHVKSDIDFTNGVTYEDYPDTMHGVVSHDGVISLASRMFKQYKKLCKLAASCYPYIFVDEYQDTNPKIIDILFNCIEPCGATIALFGDAMQSIYDGSIGDAQGLVDSGKVTLLKISQNRRNPTTVIELANQLRTDGISQQPSNDSSAPNMEHGKPKEGSAQFAFIANDPDPEAIMSSAYCQGWTSENTKILCLTHKLISKNAGFERIESFYDGKDPIVTFCSEMSTKPGVLLDMKLRDIAPEQHSSILKKNIRNDEHWKLAEDMSLSDIMGRRHFKREMLYDNIDSDGFGRDWDNCTIAIKKASDLVWSFELKDYSRLLAECGHLLDYQNNKRTIFEALSKLATLYNEASVDTTADQVFETIEANNLLPNISRNANAFRRDNPYAFAILSHIPLREFQNLFDYIDKTSPYATQHGVKGLEYENVLILLDSGGWGKYNFSYVINPSIEQTLNAGKRKSFQSIKSRTEKLLYVGCTRAKSNLLVCADKSMDTPGFRKGVEKLFGKEHIADI